METKKILTTTETPNEYKTYLMEVLIALAESNLHKAPTNAASEVAKSWGRTDEDAASDIRKAEKIYLAVKLYLSKAVNDNPSINLNYS